MNKYIGTIMGLFCIMACAARAPGTAQENEMQPPVIDRSLVSQVATAVTAQKYPDAKEVLLDSHETLRYNPDGTYTVWLEQYVKILSEEGRRNHQTFSSTFVIPYQRGPEDCQIPLIEIIKPDGKTVPIDVAKQSRVVVNSDFMDANIYNPNCQSIIVNVAGLEVGDILHYITFDRIVHPQMQDTWCNWISLEEERPILHSQVEIYCPTGRPLQSVAIKDPVEKTVTYSKSTSNGVECLKWEAHNVPQIIPEPNMPPPSSVAQRLLVSTEPNWEAVSKWYSGLVQPHLTVTPEMEAKVKELLRGLTDPEAKMMALFQFVAKEIRYLGITYEAVSPGCEPHDVRDTFTARHGVCRDKAALLVALLRTAGFDAYTTLIDVSQKKDPEVPLPYFNHAIVAVKKSDGDYLLMDPTSESSSEFFPAYLSDKSYLVASPNGEGLRTSKIIPAENNMMLIDTIGTIDAEGKLRAKTVLQFQGINDNMYRAWFAKHSPAERRQFAEGIAMKAAPHARLVDFSMVPTNIMDPSTNLTLRVSYEANDVAVRGKDGVLMSLPRLLNRIGVANFVTDQTNLKTRKYPLKTDMACGINEKISLGLDLSWGQASFMPSNSVVNNDAFVWRMEMKQEGTNLLSEANYKLNRIEWDPAAYLELKGMLRHIEDDCRRMPIYDLMRKYATAQIPTNAGPDYIILQETVNYSVTNEHCWTEERNVRKKVLTYAGIRQNSELKIAYNPAWEDVQLNKAVVVGKNGQVREVRSQEINIMDAPWVGSAPRYPAEKTMVVSFPGLEVGCIMEYSIRRICREHPMFAFYEIFRGFNPVEEKIVTVQCPTNIELGTCTAYMPKASLSSNGVYTWSITNQPGLRQEDALPPSWTYQPAVFASVGSWKGYASQLLSALKAMAAESEVAKQKARELTSREVDPWKKVQAIRDYCAVNIRVAGPELNAIPLTALTPADKTLEQGYGDTADCAILLYAMLEETGLKPEFVLVSEFPNLPEITTPFEEAPNPAAFHTVLIRLGDQCLSIPGGCYIYLNDTDQYAALGSSEHAGKWALSLADTSFEEVSPAIENSIDEMYKIEVSENGDATISVQRTYDGSEYNRQHKIITEMSPEEVRRYEQEMVSQISKDADQVGEFQIDFTNYPGRIEFSVAVPQYAAEDKDNLYFSMPEAVTKLVRVPRGQQRSLPFYLDEMVRRVVTTSVAIPHGYSVEYSPDLVEWSDGDPERVSVNQRGNLLGGINSDSRLLIHAEADFQPAILWPSRFGRYLDLTEQLSDKQAQTIWLRR